jgi:predicted ArsR family transcriptional regulator
VAALDQEVRRDLYRYLGSIDGWTSRDEAAAAIGVARSVAAFHLDKLVDAGVLAVRFERTSGRRGPGAGRPSKLYRPCSDEVGATVPDRHYDIVGAVLAAAIDEAVTTGATVGEAVRTSARLAGRVIGAETAPTSSGASGLTQTLTRYGYEPQADGDAIALRNCPFHRLADAHRQLVCGMNLELLTGVLETIPFAPPLTACLEPAEGWCCVRFRP